VRFFPKGPRPAAPNARSIDMTVNVPDVVARAQLTPLLTNEDLERLLRIDRRTVRRLCKRGQLPPPLKLGGGNRWRTEDIAEAIEMLVSARKDHKQEEVLTAAV
jgi:predicted DNA-binding transcriptional regulator AlpA